MAVGEVHRHLDRPSECPGKLTQGNSGGNTVYTADQLNAMTKAEILALAESLGYSMTTTSSNTKDEIIADFLAQQG